MATTFSVSPTTGYSGAKLAVTATGSSTSWLSGTVFSVTGGTGATISGTVVNTGAQTATFTLYVGTAAGTLTIADDADAATATIAISAPSFVISPTSGPYAQNPSILATGTHTSWTSSTTFGANGTGSVVMVSVDAPTIARFRLYSGNSATSVTVSNSADDATAAFTAAANAFIEQRGRGRLKARLDFPLASK
jgi:hypothetical protein